MTALPSTTHQLNLEVSDAIEFSAAAHADDGYKHLLLAATGSVAAIKIPNILEGLAQHHDLKIRLILTKSAAHFLQGQSQEQPSLEALLRTYDSLEAVYANDSEWLRPWTRGVPILHIELRKWADLMIVAPLSANSLAKWTAGMADGLLLSVLRAWDTDGEVDKRGVRKILACPAMNTAMWRQPATRTSLKTLEEWKVENGGWVEVLAPIQKELACGDVGSGAMVEWTEIVSSVRRLLGLDQDAINEAS